MIVASKNDVVQLSGFLHKNQWLTIKATAKLLMKDHPEGILIDCSQLSEISEDGAKTFLDAMKDIQGEGARIIVCCLPDNVLQVIRSVPGVRSQLPIAGSVEEARASLRLGASATAGGGEKTAANGIVVPIFPSLDVEHALAIASRLARDIRGSVHLIYLLEVARHLPLMTPMGEDEATANKLLSQGLGVAKRLNIPVTTHLERVRDTQEGLMQVLRTYKAEHVVLGAFADHLDDDLFHSLVDLLLHRAPCNVLIGRKALENSEQASG